MDWRSAIQAASRNGDYGRVVELCRQERRLTQRQLGDAIGLSQSAISRLEKRGAGGAYDMALLGRAAAHLNIPAGLVGLAGAPAGSAVERREFLGGVAAAAAAPVLAALPAQPETGQPAALRLGTAAYRRLDGSTPSRDLADAVRSHIQLIQRLSVGGDRARLAAVGSEAASFAGWLAWDMGDHGSARSWYGQAINSARTAKNSLLAAYQIGSLAQFEAHAGNAAQALNLVGKARTVQAEEAPAIADAWLTSVESLAHAAGGDRERADQALDRSRKLALRLDRAHTPPWPWVFTFDESKVAAVRVTCGARLGLSDWVLSADTQALATGHTKQRALLMLDIAAGHLAAGRIDGAFAIADRALDIGLTYRSGRIVERARALRRTLTTTTPPRVVRDFDDRLHDVYL
ncbi:helix-turn-helix transcriptional regulator [Streptomyces kaniharaensis]|uniref:Helix-turn-helix transcriptional regulator n=1 Tax=Streptomyces kaniharaensis TaxID=212423 RepID=A0A6N7KX04_9ACTN|nr:helix-turn-helix transcriptional regulator [Streptomyces kaniharaensis]